MIKYFYSLIFLLTSTGISAQSHTLFGEWKSYLPYSISLKLSETNNKVFCSSKFSLFSIDKEDFSIDFFDKLESLHDVQILDHAYDKFNNQLIVIYKNGNIDILTDEETYNIPDIKNNLSILGQKEVNDVNISNGEFGYFAFNFGITQFDLKNYEFGFTCFTDFIVNSITQLENTLYIGSDEGIYTFDLSTQGNASDILQWNKITSAPSANLVNFNNSIYFLSNNSILQIENNEVVDTLYKNTDNNYEIIFVNSFENHMILGKYNESNYKSKIVFIDKNKSIFERKACATILKDAIIDEDNIVWYTDFENNISYSEGINGECNSVFIDSPYSHENSDIETFGDKIFIASGGANLINYDYDLDVKNSGFYIYNDNKWKNYHERSFQFIRDNNLFYFFTITPSKVEEKVFIGTNYGGIIELDLNDNSAKIYNKETTNKKIDGAQGHYERERIIDMQFDSKNNLWISNFRALKPLVVLTNGKKWFSFDLDGEIEVGILEVDQNDYIWIKIVNDGLIVYDTKGTINDYTDDVTISLTQRNTNLPSNNIYAIKTDLDGNVWVGTDQGPIVFECASSIFDGSCSGTIKKTVLEGIAALVLDKVNVTSIEVDGANRKWIGSTSGLYVLSASGDEELIHFTTGNSPLFDNIITDLAYNSESGEMIIGTGKGVLSYKTETLEGERRNSFYAYAFPNPVTPNYNGPIAIKGLARDANVKIIDINGHIVFETKALGGQAIWHGNDLQGNRVSSGVYTALSTGTSNFDEPEAIAIKIFFIK